MLHCCSSAIFPMDRGCARLSRAARSDLARNREVYDAMGEVEQKYDPEAKGIAVIVAIETVAGMTEEGPFSMCHESA